MPIRAVCQCGKAFAAPDTLAGKTVKCPQCGQALRIPAAGANPAARTAPAPTPQPAPAVGGMSDLLDEIGMIQHAGPRCPACDAAMSPEGVVCVKCGFNRQSGLRTASSVRTGPRDMGHGEAATALLVRAAAEVAKAPVEKDDKDTGGAKSVWTWIFVVFLPLLFGIGFAAVIAWGGTLAGPALLIWHAIQSDHYLLILPALVLGAGLLLFAFGWLTVTSSALERSVVHGLLSMIFLGVYCYYWGIMNWTYARSAMQMYLSGMWTLIFGYSLLVCCVAIELGHYAVLIPMILYTAGNFVAFLGSLNVMLTAVEESFGQGLACLLTGIYTPIYGCMHWAKCKKDMIIFFIGVGLMMLAAFLYVLLVIVMHVIESPNVLEFFEKAASRTTGQIIPIHLPYAIAAIARDFAGVS